MMIVMPFKDEGIVIIRIMIVMSKGIVLRNKGGYPSVLMGDSIYLITKCPVQETAAIKSPAIIHTIVHLP